MSGRDRSLLSRLGRPEEAVDPEEYVSRALRLFYSNERQLLDEGQASPQLEVSTERTGDLMV